MHVNFKYLLKFELPQADPTPNNYKVSNSSFFFIPPFSVSLPPATPSRGPDADREPLLPATLRLPLGSVSSAQRHHHRSTLKSPSAAVYRVVSSAQACKDTFPSKSDNIGFLHRQSVFRLAFLPPLVRHTAMTQPTSHGIPHITPSHS
ncbi:hypothetical protein M9H77_14011 [Catharanthus roseus]|uniref:Uncharacterized protein n=1 Tax=Catharanthus roseus TaxID=4058 RepID=A0ACC0BM32_CATRO|nr:hypothetical protein M9H77_14011 [Catharanthus roseus]